VIIWSPGYPGSEWVTFAVGISSVYNNLDGVPWAPFYDPTHGNPPHGENYYAAEGWPARWVGTDWNDHFTAACAC